MKPYGNEHLYHDDNMNSTKTGQKPLKCKRDSRRLAKKARRAQDKKLTRPFDFLEKFN